MICERSFPAIADSFEISNYHPFAVEVNNLLNNLANEIRSNFSEKINH